MGGGASSTSRVGSTKLNALDVAAIATKHRQSDLTGQVFIVTGGNNGIGFQTVRSLASQNATVILAGRNEKKCEDATKKINDEFLSKKAGHEAKEEAKPLVSFLKLDLADFESIQNFVQEFLALDVPLHCLINNAGLVMFENKLTKQGFEMTFGVNHLGVFLLTNLLLDKIKASTPSRIVTVSSELYKRGIFTEDVYPAKEVSPYGISTGTRFYQDSKYMNVLFALKLHRMLEGSGVTSYVVHPGVLKTGLSRGVGSVAQAIYSVVSSLFLKSPNAGAATSVYCATVPSVVEDAGNFFQDCHVEPFADSTDVSVEQQDKLWVLSEKLTGLQ